MRVCLAKACHQGLVPPDPKDAFFGGGRCYQRSAEREWECSGGEIKLPRRVAVANQPSSTEKQKVASLPSPRTASALQVSR